MGEPVTKQDLDQAMGVVRSEMAAMESRLRIDIAADMVAMEERLSKRFDGFAANIAQVMSELPKQLAELRADFDGHACNYRLHKRPVAMSTKRLRRTRSR